MRRDAPIRAAKTAGKAWLGAYGYKLMFSIPDMMRVLLLLPMYENVLKRDSRDGEDIYPFAKAKAWLCLNDPEYVTTWSLISIQLKM